MKKKVFLYLSDTTPDGSLLSIQEKVLEGYCKQNGWQVVKAFSDLNELLEAVKRKETDIVLVDTLARLSKDSAEIQHLIELFTANNVVLVSIAESKNIEGMI